MITLAELRKMTHAMYPGTNVDLSHMLAAWISKDPKGYLANLIPDFYKNRENMIKALKSYFQAPEKEDKQILFRCVLAAEGKQPTGWHLLSELGKHRGHPFCKVALEYGFDPAILIKKVPSPNGRLDERLIDLDIDIEPSQANQMLRYGRDLTALAGQGLFDDLCDRPDEIDRLLDVLLRRKKSNIALTGSAGVGKTALIELFSRKLIHDEIFSMAPDTSVIEVSMGKLVAGTKYRGDFEKRLENVINAFELSQPAIMFIDEMHLIWGTGRADGSQTDAANLLKPILARENFRVIGATTSAEYHKTIARDPALARRFQEVWLAEPDSTATFEIAKKQADSLIRHHNIQISDTAIQTAVEATNQYMVNRYQPDKTIDLLDSAAVYARRNGRSTVTEDDLYRTLSYQTNCPGGKWRSNDDHGLLTLAQRLKKRVVGQAQIIEKVVSTLAHRLQDLGNPSRNLGTFLFSGATGVGKTELAKSVAVEFFDNQKALLHLDLGEYSQAGSVNNLIGSPRGYVGSQEKGVLINWLHDRGGGVILFDEVEKACPEVHHLLLGILDNGRIRSSQGAVLDTRQSVVILTTNALLPSELNPNRMGFNPASNRVDPEKLLLNHFPGEFLARFDEILLFNTLGPHDTREIVRLRLTEALENCRKKKIEVVHDEIRLLDYLMGALERNGTGARGIGRLVEKKILQPIAMGLLGTNAQGNRTVILDTAFYETGIIKVQ